MRCNEHPHAVAALALIAAFAAVPVGFAMAATNLLPNGDFNQGNTGFDSDYDYSPGFIQAEGTYCIDTDATHCHSSATSFPDHTGGNGSMLIANGEFSSGLGVWFTSVPVVAGRSYRFSGWATTWSLGSDPSPPRLHVEASTDPLRPQQVGDDVTLPAANGQWTPFGGIWQATQAGDAFFIITDLNTDAGGNDFALDDLSVTPVTNCELYRKDFKAHITAMRDSEDKIVRIGCVVADFSTNPSPNFDIQCTAAVSTAVSDLANDLLTAFDVVDTLTGGKASDIKNDLLEDLSATCKADLQKALLNLAKSLKGDLAPIVPILNAYIQAHLQADVVCDQVADFANRVLDELNDNTYSTGHKCAAGTLDVRVPSLDADAVVSFSTFPMLENDPPDYTTPYPGCPQERTSPVVGVYWGAGGHEHAVTHPKKCSLKTLSP